MDEQKENIHAKKDANVTMSTTREDAKVGVSS